MDKHYLGTWRLNVQVAVKEVKIQTVHVVFAFIVILHDSCTVVCECFAWHTSIYPTINIHVNREADLNYWHVDELGHDL